MSDGNGARPVRDNLYRVATPPVEIRSEDTGPNGRPILFGYFARFNEWTEIDSMFEGHFMERFSPGAFKKTLSENTPKVLFQHGRDQMVGSQPIAEIIEVREDDEGAFYEAELLDGVPELVVSGLRAGLYGASFRFSIVREERDKSPAASEDNPDGIEQRTVKEAAVAEFGPVTFPAYENATAGIRATAGFRTDLEFLQRLAADPERLRSLIESMADTRDLEPEGAERAEQGNPDDAEHQAEDTADAHLDREQDQDNAPPTETPDDPSTSPQGRRASAGSPLRLPRTPRPTRAGVLPNPQQEEEDGWKPLRLP